MVTRSLTAITQQTNQEEILKALLRNAFNISSWFEFERKALNFQCSAFKLKLINFLEVLQSNTSKKFIVIFSSENYYKTLIID
ncbi:MAG: hypothetical protein DCF19_00670 [Pseudanabaena frigida]|uniref:Uncharacterized protein n=1 Tax=Pseudanabaena frigida TaxID=945775 RepID=A0A2W4WKK3_9CYAN|nr:MAG: hypothetical protein DCF19_00670 [Pseudanabaena frigida]